MDNILEKEKEKIKNTGCRHRENDTGENTENKEHPDRYDQSGWQAAGAVLAGVIIGGIVIFGSPVSVPTALTMAALL